MTYYHILMVLYLAAVVNETPPPMDKISDDNEVTIMPSSKDESSVVDETPKPLHCEDSGA